MQTETQAAERAGGKLSIAARPGASRRTLTRKAAEKGGQAEPEGEPMEASFPAEDAGEEEQAAAAAAATPAGTASVVTPELSTVSEGTAEPEHSALLPFEGAAAPIHEAGPADALAPDPAETYQPAAADAPPAPSGPLSQEPEGD